MSESHDGPRSTLFDSIPVAGNTAFDDLGEPVVSSAMAEGKEHAPTGMCTAWGIPFDIGEKVVLIRDAPVSINVGAFQARWLVFLHTTDIDPQDQNRLGFLATAFKGTGGLNEHLADYVILYADGTDVRFPIKRPHQIGKFDRIWGENCVQSVVHHKPVPVRQHHEQMHPEWGRSQYRVDAVDFRPWVDWLWAWENPHPKKEIVGFRFEPLAGTIILSAISGGDVSSNPVRWLSRRKAKLVLPAGTEFAPTLDEDGQLAQIRLDMGQVISALPQAIYPKDEWNQTYNNKLPELSGQEILIEYTAHPDAHFHLFDGSTVPLSDLEAHMPPSPLRPVARASQLVTVRVVEQGSTKPVAVKLHLHGEAGEYLAPNDRHRIPNTAWFEDYSVDFSHLGIHHCTYISGETRVRLPLGKVYAEISKGFEIRPVRKVLDITAETEAITVEIDRVLPWRERGWVTADTHVHFLSPGSALLEGAGEGVNLVNLLASQWGELMTNVGDFDGKTTWGSREAGGDGEYLVRVGTENRQHTMGHISLLGYEGSIIAPMTTGGPSESALGDPIEVLLTEWAKQCKAQNGVVIIPHFPGPRLENAAAIISGNVDGVEMTSWGDLYGGINPYSLADWYRYLNCGAFVAAVGGTDKMSATTAVGTSRTYAKIEDNREFALDSWKASIENGHTFVTYGPLLEFAVDGNAPGSWIKMSSNGGAVDVTWKVASVTVPMSRVELVVNGEVLEGQDIDAWEDGGYWSVKVERSSWLALLVRGHYADKPELIAAHSSPVMVRVEESPFFAAADAVTILEQIEGAIAYLDTVGTRAETVAYKRMRMVLESQHRALHNRMHELGNYHDHNPITDHPRHH